MNFGNNNSIHLYKYYYLQYFHRGKNYNSYTYSVRNLNQGNYYLQACKIFSTNKDFCRFYYLYIAMDRVYFGNNNYIHLDKYYHLQYFHKDMNSNSYTYSVRNLNQGNYYLQACKIFSTNKDFCRFYYLYIAME